MYTREQIIEEIKRVATKLGVLSLAQEDFEKHSMVPMSTIRYYLGTWKQALQEAGLGQVVDTERNVKQVPEGEEPLLQDLLRLYQETGEIPTPALIEAKGKFYTRHYLERWRSIGEAYQLAEKRFLALPSPTAPKTVESFPSPPLIETAQTIFEENGPPPPIKNRQNLPQAIGESIRLLTESFIQPADMPMDSLEMEGLHEFQKKTFDFRGIRAEPVTKIGVAYFFGTIHRELGYTIHSLLAGNPDCRGERWIDRSNRYWEPVDIYFEYRSSQFSRPAGNNGIPGVIVCWLHDCQGCLLDVLELSSAIQQLPSR